MGDTEPDCSPSEVRLRGERSNYATYKIMFVIPRIGDKVEAIRPTKLRSFFAFPYGVLCLASYINKVTGGAHDIKIVDLNRFNVEQGLTQFRTRSTLSIPISSEYP